eukprot:2577501-Pyramimonas_sp.AAC.1
MSVSETYPRPSTRRCRRRYRRLRPPLPRARLASRRHPIGRGAPARPRPIGREAPARRSLRSPSPPARRGAARRCAAPRANVVRGRGIYSHREPM